MLTGCNIATDPDDIEMVTLMKPCTKCKCQINQAKPKGRQRKKLTKKETFRIMIIKTIVYILLVTVALSTVQALVATFRTNEIKSLWIFDVCVIATLCVFLCLVAYFDGSMDKQELALIM